MKRKMTFVTLVILIAAILIPAIIGASSALAEGGYAVDWWTVDNGGGTSQSAGGQYTLNGTIGQPDASTNTEGGTYAVSGGFWVRGILDLLDFIIHLPLVLRS